MPRRTITFAQLDAHVTRTAAMLSALGAGAGDTIANAVNDLYLNWLITLGLARLGVASAPGPDRESFARISDAANSKPDFLIGPREIAMMQTSDPPALKRPIFRPDATGRIMLSSGTTGVEKRVALSWRMIDASIRNVPIAYGASPGPWLMVNPPHANLPFVLTLGCWALGTSVLMLDRKPDAQNLQEYRPGLIAFLPSQLSELIETLPATFRKLPMRVVTGGAPVPSALLKRSRDLLTDDLLSVYGMSECGAVAIATPELWDRAASAAGVVLPDVTLEIVDDNGSQVSPGELGHVRVRSDRSAGRYLTGPTHGFQNGWFWPGDLGRIDAEGVLYIEGRTDDLMNIGGEKVVPAWIEAAALEAPGVREAAAFSVKRPDGIERCWLTIVATGKFDGQALSHALHDRIVVVGDINWFTVDALPRNAAGKIDRVRLRVGAEEICQKAVRAGA